jgi:hypothetical protein
MAAPAMTAPPKTPGALWLDYGIMDQQYLHWLAEEILALVRPLSSSSGSSSRAGSLRWQQAGRALGNIVSDKLLVTTLLRLALIRYCFRVAPATPAMRALGLHYKFPTSSNAHYWLSFFSVLPWVYQTFLRHLIMKLYLNNHSQQRWRLLGQVLLQISDSVGPLLQLWTCLECWYSGVTVDPASRLAGLTVVAESLSSPRASVDFAHRRWLFDAAMKLFRTVSSSLETYTLPLLWAASSTLQEAVSHYVQRKLLGSNHNSSTCPCCQAPRNAMIVPVSADCPCHQVYCYACLYTLSRGHGGGGPRTCRSCHYNFTSWQRKVNDSG